MLFAFVDETSDFKYPDYFGLCVATVNSTYYRTMKNGFQNILNKEGWDPSIEFKGSYLFSATKGCSNISVMKRVEIASNILDLTASDVNSRMKFYYLRGKTADQKKYYTHYLPRLLKRALPTPSKKSGKDLLALNCDRRDDVDENIIRKLILDTIKERGYTLFEDIVLANSCFHTVGILYADVVGYLLGRIDTISMDSEMFDNISEEDYEKNGKLKKLKSSKNLIEKVKFIKRYRVKEK